MSVDLGDRSAGRDHMPVSIAGRQQRDAHVCNMREGLTFCGLRRSAPGGLPRGRPTGPRSLRDRHSLVKGASGVAPRWRKRHPGPASLHGPPVRGRGQTEGLPAALRVPAGLGSWTGDLNGRALRRWCQPA